MHECVHMSTSVYGGQSRCQISWSWSYTWLWAAWHGYWKLNLGFSGRVATALKHWAISSVSLAPSTNVCFVSLCFFETRVFLCNKMAFNSQKSSCLSLSIAEPTVSMHHHTQPSITFWCLVTYFSDRALAHHVRDQHSVPILQNTNNHKQMNSQWGKDIA